MIPSRLLLLLADDFVESPILEIVVAGPYRFERAATFSAGAVRSGAFSAGGKSHHAFSAGALRSGAKET